MATKMRAVPVLTVLFFKLCTGQGNHSLFSDSYPITSEIKELNIKVAYSKSYITTMSIMKSYDGRSTRDIEHTALPHLTPIVTSASASIDYSSVTPTVTSYETTSSNIIPTYSMEGSESRKSVIEESSILSPTPSLPSSTMPDLHSTSFLVTTPPSSSENYNLGSAGLKTHSETPDSVTSSFDASSAVYRNTGSSSSRGIISENRSNFDIYPSSEFVQDSMSSGPSNGLILPLSIHGDTLSMSNDINTVSETKTISVSSVIKEVVTTFPSPDVILESPSASSAEIEATRTSEASPMLSSIQDGLSSLSTVSSSLTPILDPGRGNTMSVVSALTTQPSNRTILQDHAKNVSSLNLARTSVATMQDSSIVVSDLPYGGSVFSSEYQLVSFAQTIDSSTVMSASVASATMFSSSDIVGMKESEITVDEIGSSALPINTAPTIFSSNILHTEPTSGVTTTEEVYGVTSSTPEFTSSMEQSTTTHISVSEKQATNIVTGSEVVTGSDVGHISTQESDVTHIFMTTEEMNTIEETSFGTTTETGEDYTTNEIATDVDIRSSTTSEASQPDKSSPITVPLITDYIDSTSFASTTKRVTYHQLYNVTYEIVFEGECATLVKKEKIVLGEFWLGLRDILTHNLSISKTQMKPLDIVCKPIRIVFSIYNVPSIENITSQLFKVVDSGSLVIPVLIPEEDRTTTYVAVKLNTKPTFNKNDLDDIYNVGLSQIDIIVIISVCIFSMILVCLGCVVCAREYYIRKRTRSFDLSEIVNLNSRPEDFSLTKYPRPKVTYSENGMKMHSLGRKSGLRESETTENEAVETETLVSDIQLRLNSSDNGLMVSVTGVGASDRNDSIDYKLHSQSRDLSDEMDQSKALLVQQGGSPIHSIDNPIYFADDDRFAPV